MGEHLETVLEECRQRLAQGESVDQCLAAYPTHAEALRELLPLLSSLRDLAPAPDPRYVHAARQRFHSRLQEAQRRQMARERTPAPLHLLRRIAIPVATLAALAGSGAGLVTASADALPGSPLFPVQQAQEQVVQRLARTPEQQVDYQLNLAAHRLRQIRRAEALHAAPLTIDELTAGMLQATARAAQAIRTVPEPQRQRLLATAAPLLTQEERLLAQERKQGNNPAALELRRQQLLDAQKHLLAAPTASTNLPQQPAAGPSVASSLHSAQTAPTTSPRLLPTSQPIETPQATVISGSTVPKRAAGTLPALPGANPATTRRPTATPQPAIAHYLPSIVATRTARLRRFLVRNADRTPQPVHPGTP